MGGTPTVLQPDLPLGGTPTVLQPDEPTSPQVSQTQLAGIPTEIQPDEPTPQEAPASTPTSKTLEPAPTQTPTNSSLDEDAHSFVPPTIFPRPGTASPLGFTQVIRSFLLQPQGLFLITLSTLISSVYNVAIRVMFQPASQILGIFEVEQLILPTLGNSLLILMLRMLVVMPLMLVLAPILHPRVWLDLQSLLDAFKSRINKHNKDGKKALLLCILGGVFLFLSQILLYIAIGQVSVGMAIALFFIYPTISSLLSWFLLRDFPTPFRAITISTIFLGELLVLGGVVRVDTGNIFLGSLSAIAGGAMFAFYVVITRICSTKVHPVTFTLINFATMLFLCFTGLMVLPFFPVSGLSLQVNTNKILELILTAFILGMLTLCGYLFNNFGIRKLGASRSAIIGALVPVITVVFAGIVIQESLQPLQILGILLLTFGAAAVSFEKIRNN
ncbi:hypothetical protein RintRC_2278 [Richelia intracellularis]|nr:hypothetical protein RintRC_2278 [Richelia intracellularis]